MSVLVENIDNMVVKIVSGEESTVTTNGISASDMEMDKRAVAAVNSAIERAKICNKPIARYDVKSRRAFLEYSDGSIEYVN